MPSPVLNRIAACMALVPLMLASAPLSAQEQGGEQTTPPAEDAVCMARPLGDVAQVRAEQRGQPFRILTIERAASAMERRGFERVDCMAADLAAAGKREAWRDEICEAASVGNQAVQNQLERAYGERPAVLCAAAEVVAGPWNRNATPLE